MPDTDDNDAPPSRAPGEGRWLLVMSPAGTITVPLPERGTVTLGRAEDCGVRIDDRRLSRKHAELRVGEDVEIVDLGSMNGTLLRDRRLSPNAPTAIRIGDAVKIGNTVLLLQRAREDRRERPVLSHAYFEARLAEECARAGQGGAPFAVARLRVGRAGGGSLANATEEDRAAPAVLAAWLEDTDIVAEYAPHEYSLLLPSTTAERAEARARALRAGESGSPIRIGLAVYPRDGRTAAALVERASHALHADRPGEPGPGGVVPTALDRMDPIVRRIAAGTINVLILGETGVGKEVLARRIHELSSRAKMPLVSINCAALSESLLESELFGHEKGAFTGALAAKAGLLESADGGSVFLDEAGEMPLGLQAKLLRAIEQREVTRVGALRPRVVDVRFIAATNRKLELDAVEGRFRQDLYFRLNGITLTIPALRERVDEIAPLANAFAAQACLAMGMKREARISRPALDQMERYPWPGNIRELRNVVERAVLLSSGGIITPDHLMLDLTARTIAPAAPPSIPERAPADTAERDRIAAALEECGGNQSQAAKQLGIARGTLIKRIEEFGLRRPRKRS